MLTFKHILMNTKSSDQVLLCKWNLPCCKGLHSYLGWWEIKCIKTFRRKPLETLTRRTRMTLRQTSGKGRWRCEVDENGSELCPIVGFGNRKSWTFEFYYKLVVVKLVFWIRTADKLSRLQHLLPKQISHSPHPNSTPCKLNPKGMQYLLKP